MEKILSGRCKEDFEKWYRMHPSYNSANSTVSTTIFYRLPFGFQYGVYVDWFDSVGIRFEVSCIIDFFDKDCYQFSVHHEATQYYIEMTIERNDGAKKAIEKANEIYNENQEL